jgi:hypothetical protein
MEFAIVFASLALIAASPPSGGTGAAIDCAMEHADIPP